MKRQLCTLSLFTIILTLSSMSHSVAQCVTPPSGLVSWWPGDGNADDLVGGNTGTLENGATFGPGKVGQAFSLDGVDDYVLIGNPESLKITEAITIGAWINPQDLSERQVAEILSKIRQSMSLDSYALALVKSGGVNLLVGAIGNGTADRGLIGGVIPPNSWSHVAMTYDSISGENILYVNGQQVAWRMRSGGIRTSDVNVLIGREDSTSPRPFPGVIDEVEIFNRVLTEEEIHAIFFADSAGKCKALLLTCLGFEAPMDGGVVTVKKNRVLPLKAQLFDGDGFEITDFDITSPPIIQILFDSSIEDAMDVTDYALSAGHRTDYNQFVFTEDWKWQFNLKTKNYSAAGTYTISMVSGDESEYTIDNCEAQFVIN